MPCNAFVVCPAEKGQFSRRLSSNMYPFSRTIFASHNCIRKSNIGTRVKVLVHSSNIKDIAESEVSYTELPNVVLEAVVKAAKAAVEKSTGEGTESGGPGLQPPSLPNVLR